MSRHIPITIDSQDLFMIQQAKMQVERNYLDGFEDNVDKRYNFRLNDTIDQERVNRNVDVACNRQKYVMPKVANKSAHPDHNIAIYDVHSPEINNTSVLGNLIPEKLKADARRKIQYPNSYVKDYVYVQSQTASDNLPERYSAGIDVPLDKDSFDKFFADHLKNVQRGGGTEHFTNDDQGDPPVSNYGYTQEYVSPNPAGYLHSLVPSDTNLPEPDIFDDYDSPHPDSLSRAVPANMRDIIVDGSTGSDTRSMNSSVISQSHAYPNAAAYPSIRMQQNLQTQQRQFRDEGSRITAGWNLHKSDYIKERNARQREADIALQHNGQVKIPWIKTADYLDFLDRMAQNERAQFIEDNISDEFSRNPGGYKHAIMAPSVGGKGTIRFMDEDTGAVSGRGSLRDTVIHGDEQGTRDEDVRGKRGKKPSRAVHGNINETNVTEHFGAKIHDEECSRAYYDYDQMKDNNLKYSANHDLRKFTTPLEDVRDRSELYENAQQMINEEPFMQKTVHVSPWENVRHTSVDSRVRKPLTDIFTDIPEEDPLFINHKQQLHQKQMETGKREQFISNYPIVNTVRRSPKESFKKSDHILVTRTGNVKNVYTDPNSEQVAPVLITVDNQNRPVRTFATLAKGNLQIIQQRDPSYLDIADGNYLNEDMLSLVVPMEILSPRLRENVAIAASKAKMAKRQVLELPFEDLVEIANIVYAEQDHARRLKLDTLRGQLAGSKFDEQLIYGYENKIFTTPWVIEEIEKNERMILKDRSERIAQKDTQEIDVGGINIPDTSSSMSQGNRGKNISSKVETSMKDKQFGKHDLYFDPINNDE